MRIVEFVQSNRNREEKHAEASQSNAGYIMIALPEYYPERSTFDGELSEPAKDPEVCELFLRNLRYFYKHKIPLSCGQPVAPDLVDKIKPVEWENLDPEKYSALFKEVVIKVFPPKSFDDKTYPAAAVLSSWRNAVQSGSVVFRRAKLKLSGHVYLPSKNSPTEKIVAFQIVQFGFDVTNSNNPNPHFRCVHSDSRNMPDEHQTVIHFFIASGELHELYGDFSDYQDGFGGDNL